MITLSEGLIRQARIMKWTGLIMFPCLVAFSLVLLLTLASLEDHRPDSVRSLLLTFFGVLPVSSGIFLITSVVYVLLLRRNARQTDPASLGYFRWPFLGFVERRLTPRGSAAVAADKERGGQAVIWVPRVGVPCAFVLFLFAITPRPGSQADLPASLRGSGLGAGWWVISVVIGIFMSTLLVCAALAWCRACRTDGTTAGGQACGPDITDNTSRDVSRVWHTDQTDK